MLAKAGAVQQHNALFANHDDATVKELKQIVSDVLVRNAELEFEAKSAHRAATRARKKARKLAVNVASKDDEMARDSWGAAAVEGLVGKGFCNTGRKDTIKRYVDSLQNHFPGNLTKQLTIVKGLT